jgi:hypothetical protein
MKTINLKEPIDVTFYGDDEPMKYTKIGLTKYPYPENTKDQGILLLPENNQESAILTVSVNLRLGLPENKVAININDTLIKNQALPALIKQGILEAEPDFQVPSGFVQYPIHTILI